MKILAFEVPIYKYKVNNWNYKKKKLLELFDSVEHKILGNVITSPIDIRTSILDEEINLLENQVNLKFNVCETWFQKYDNKMNHSAHTHGPMGFSAVCFIEYDKSYHNPTTFISPFNCPLSGNVPLFQPDVIEGDIIFFPSNILHFSPVNLSNKSRLIMSFNLNLSQKTKKNNLSYT